MAEIEYELASTQRMILDRVPGSLWDWLLSKVSNVLCDRGSDLIDSPLLVKLGWRLYFRTRYIDTHIIINNYYQIKERKPK